MTTFLFHLRWPQDSMHRSTLDSMYLNINGIKKFWVTADYKASIAPENGKVSMREDREIIFQWCACP